MLTHTQNPDADPSAQRVIVIGGNSFIGRGIVSRLQGKGYDTLALTRADVDLAEEGAGEKLATFLQADDVAVAVSAVAPCRNTQDFLVNAKIINAYVQALTASPVAYLLNISSDAVYPDEPVPLTEAVPAAPGSMHGAMHAAREIALAGLGLPFASLRPTLVYGASDPHNGYGPNQFRRLANAGQAIKLFGAGEERRDHVYIDDVVELATRMISRRSTGVLNAASGTVTSFADVARRAVDLAGRTVPIETRPRSGPMPHNGYRPFDPAATKAAFPDFEYTDIDTGMKTAQDRDAATGS